MPWGWECKAKFVKQNPTKPTERRGLISGGINGPGPDSYETPQIFCGKGYSKIKRAPAYSFGRRTPAGMSVLASNAPILDVCKYGPKGQYKIKHGVVSPRFRVPQEKSQMPGPGSYAPRSEIQFKRPPAYSMRPAPRPPYKSRDEWTPSPNMYLPLKPMMTSPAYSFSNTTKDLKGQNVPCPGDYYPKFNYIQRTTPGFSFGALFKALKQPEVPSPNAYCEKKFMYPKRSTPAPSFGIRHSPYIGKEKEYLKPSNLNVIICGE